MKLRTVYSFTAAVTALVAIASPVTSYAGKADAKVMPGSECAVKSGGSPRITYYGLDNAGSSVMKIVCPVVRDDTTGTLDWMNVAVYDTNALSRKQRGDVACQLAYSSRTIPEVSWGRSEYTEGLSYTKNYDLPLSNPRYEYDQGSFFVYCELPARDRHSGRDSRIVSYYYGED